MGLNKGFLVGVGDAAGTGVPDKTVNVVGVGVKVGVKLGLFTLALIEDEPF